MTRAFWLFLLGLPLWSCSGGGGDIATGSTGAVPIAAPHVSSQVLVMAEEPDDDDEVNEIMRDFSGLAIERVGQSAFFLLTLPPGSSVEAILEELDDDLRIVQSEPNYLGQAPEGGPSDVPILGGDALASIAPQAGLAALQLPAAHGITTGAGVLVAVLDTGVEFNHPYLRDSLDPGGFDFIGQDFFPAEERNFLDDDGDGSVDEQFGHGTFVASLVHAVAPDARILPIRVLNDEGFGTAATVAAGIYWAVDAGATVINISVDIPNAPEVVKDAIDYAGRRDVVVVAAAGNGGAPEIIFPARFGQVIAVTAVDGAGVAAPFSNVGSKVALVAPGVALIGAVPESLNVAGTARWSGTSFASPLVAGAAALVRSAFPGLGRTEVGNRLVQSASSVDALNPSAAGRLGSGMVQPFRALQ